ncbi:MAG: hypothetical protein U1F63_09070 [Chitinivorax sp.]
MKNPYAPPPRPETDLQHKARKLAAWHEQQAAACDLQATRASSAAEKQQAQQQAAWHRETAAAWRALIDIEQPMPAPGSFSVRG